MADILVKKIQTVDGDALIDYTALANKPDSKINASIKSLSVSGKTVTYTKNDGTTGTITTQDTTYSAMTGATTSAAGKAGLVPAPAAGAATRYLRSDGTWQVPPDTNTTYSAATTSAAGLMSAADKSKLDGIASGANAYTLPTATGSVTGGVKLSDSTSSTSAASAGVAATPAAVKASYDLAAAAMPKSGGSFTGVVGGMPPAGSWSFKNISVHTSTWEDTGTNVERIIMLRK